MTKTNNNIYILKNDIEVPLEVRQTIYNVPNGKFSGDASMQLSKLPDISDEINKKHADGSNE